MTEVAFIYLGFCPATGDSYVGKTTRGEARFKEHARKRSSVLFGRSVIYSILEYCKPSRLHDREEYWIRVLCPTLNRAELSHGRTYHNALSREKISKAVAEQMKDEAHRERIRKSNEETWKNEGLLTRHKAIAKEIANRPEVKAKKSIAALALWQDPEFRARRAAARIAKIQREREAAL